MDTRSESQATPVRNRTTVERKSERELVVTRTFNELLVTLGASAGQS
jgi:hypothetical protein